MKGKHAMGLFTTFDKRQEPYVKALKNTVEDNLPQEMKDVKRRALDGEAEAQYLMSRYYQSIWDKVTDKDYAMMNKDMRAYASAHHVAALHFELQAEWQGHEKAIATSKSRRRS